MAKNNVIWWIFGTIVLFLIINHYVGFIDFKELFIVGRDAIPSSTNVVGSGGAR